jgi:D-inositol-3-phosphate glycosyltransferase
MLSFEGIDAGRITKIDPGVDLDTFSPGPGDRAALGLREDDFVILFVGWFVPRKGVDFLLYAVRRLIDELPATAPRVRVVLVGSGFGRERVEALTDRLGLREACVFTGALTYDRMPDVFRACDVFVLPSVASEEWQEQFGMSLIEAMACGKPCIASLSGAIEEIAGDCSLLVQPNDFLSIQKALRRLVNEPSLRADLGDAARTRAVQRFNIHHHADALSDVYEVLLAR